MVLGYVRFATADVFILRQPVKSRELIYMGTLTDEPR